MKYRPIIAVLTVASLFAPQMAIAGSLIQAGTDNGTEAITPDYVSPEIIPSIFTDSPPPLSQYQFEQGVANSIAAQEWFTENLPPQQDPITIITETAAEDPFAAFIASLQIPEALPVPSPSSDVGKLAEEQVGASAAQTLSQTAQSAALNNINRDPPAVTGANFPAGSDGAIVAETVAELRREAATVDAQIGELESDLQVSVKALAAGNLDQDATEAHARSVGSVLKTSQRLREEALAKQNEAFDTLFLPRWGMNPADRTLEGDLIAKQAHEEAIQDVKRSERLMLDASMTLGRLAAKTGESFFGVLPPEPFGGGPVKPVVTQEAQAYFTAANLFNVSREARECRCKMETRNVDLRASESSIISSPGAAGSVVGVVMKPAETIVKTVGGDNVYEESPIGSRIGEFGVRGVVAALTGGLSLVEILARVVGGYIVEKIAEATGVSQALADAAMNAVNSSVAFAASREITVREISNVIVPNDEPAEGELMGFTASDTLEPLDFSSGGGGGISVAAPGYTPPDEVLDDQEDNPSPQAPQCRNICSGQGITTKPENSYFVGPQTCSSAPYGSCNNVVYYTGWLCNPGFIQNAEGTECLPIVQATDPPEVTLAATPGSVQSGGSSTLSWTIANASSCDAAGGWSGIKNGPAGSEIVSNIITTTIYTLTCTNAYGTATATTTVALADEDFALVSVGRLSIRAVTGQRATSTSVTVKVSPMNGFNDSVALSASLAPALDGFDYAYGDPSLSESEYDRGSSFEVYLPTGEIESGYVVTVRGVSGPLTRTLDLPLSLTPVQPRFEEF